LKVSGGIGMGFIYSSKVPLGFWKEFSLISDFGEKRIVGIFGPKEKLLGA